jgi:hypothetical protein
MDRRKSGIVDFSSDFPCVTTAPTSADHHQTLRLFHRPIAASKPSTATADS